MGVSKSQKHIEVQCACGCGQTYMAFPVYKNKRTVNTPENYTTIQGKRTKLYVSKYKTGHHPKSMKNQFGNTPWNKGLNKTDERVARQGRKGKDHHNYQHEQNPDFSSKDFDFVYYSRTYGHRARSKGGNKLYYKLREFIIDRDKQTCQDCGKDLSETIDPCQINVHHIVPVKQDHDRIFDPNNLKTLCFSCHVKYHRNK